MEEILLEWINFRLKENLNSLLILLKGLIPQLLYWVPSVFAAIFQEYESGVLDVLNYNTGESSNRLDMVGSIPVHLKNLGLLQFALEFQI